LKQKTVGDGHILDGRTVDLAISAVFKNEASYLDEWITFHQAQGFSRFFLFNDNSTDNFLEVLEPYLAAGVVVLDDAPEAPHFIRRQEASYDLALALARNDCAWLAFIDIDEFLFSPSGAISDVLPANPLIAGVFIWWRIFGSSGHQSPPEVGVLLGFTRSAKFPKNLRETKEALAFGNRDFFAPRKRPIQGTVIEGKSIVRPRLVRKAGVHVPQSYLGLMIDENKKLYIAGSSVLVRAFRWCMNRIYSDASDRRVRVPTTQSLRINHYWSKSISELEKKAAKWDSNLKGASLEDYLRWDNVLNEVEDREILNHVPQANSSA